MSSATRPEANATRQSGKGQQCTDRLLACKQKSGECRNVRFDYMNDSEKPLRRRTAKKPLDEPLVRRPGLRQLPKDFDDLATGKTERLPWHRPAPEPLSDSREGAVIPGVRNAEARQVYDVRLARMREALARGDEAALGSEIEQVRRLMLWRARNVTDLRALAESVLGASPELADRWVAAAEADERPTLPAHVLALAIRVEAALSASSPNARVELIAGPNGTRLSLDIALDDVTRAVDALSEAGRAADALRRFLRSDDERPQRDERVAAESDEAGAPVERAAADNRGWEQDRGERWGTRGGGAPDDRARDSRDRGPARDQQERGPKRFGRSSGGDDRRGPQADRNRGQQDRGPARDNRGRDPQGGSGPRDDRPRPFQDRSGPRDDGKRSFPDRGGARDDRPRPFQDRNGPRDDRKRSFPDRGAARDDRPRPFQDRSGPRDDRKRSFPDRGAARDDRPFPDRGGARDDRPRPFPDRGAARDDRPRPFPDRGGARDDRPRPFQDRSGPRDDRPRPPFRDASGPYKKGGRQQPSNIVRDGKGPNRGPRKGPPFPNRGPKRFVKRDR
jgi:hypothetical protein